MSFKRACIPFGGETVDALRGYICITPTYRLKLGNKYITMAFHPHTGPSFYHDRAMDREYDPVDENDPIWDVFEVWLKKQEAK